MIRYYYTGRGGEFVYICDLHPTRNIIKSNDHYVSISLTFNPMKITRNNIIVNDKDWNKISFIIFGFLYHLNQTSDERLNCTSFLNEQNATFQNQTTHVYEKNSTEKWTLIFENIPRVDNYNYDLQLQVNSIIENNIFNEEFLIFNTKIDLTDIKLDEDFPYWWVIIGVGGGIILILVVFFVIKYIRLQKRKKDLEEEMKSFAYSNNIQQNVIKKEKKAFEKDSDYDTTFI